MSSQPDQIPAEVAYQAAQDRALRTVAALITSEALVLSLRAELERTRAESESRVTRLHTRIRELIAEVAEARGEVADDATSDEGGAALGPSYPPVAFSD